MSTKTAIVGVGQTGYRFKRTDVTIQELAQDAAAKALEHAHMEMADIDAFVLGVAPDALIGIDNVDRWIGQALGVAPRPQLRVNTGGTTGAAAAQAGYVHIASGMFRTVMVLAADKVSETPDAQWVLNTAMDPIYERSLALNAINMCSFQAVRQMSHYGVTERQLAAVAVRSRHNAAANPYAHLREPITIDDVLSSRYVCWPLKLLDCCPRSSGACAVIMAAEQPAVASRDRPAWIQGMGATSNTIYMGDKMGPGRDTDHADWDELAIATAKAYTHAGVTDPLSQIDAAEIYAPFTCTEIAAVEALGFCPKGTGGRAGEQGMFDMGGPMPINPSGGVLSANPISATALARVAEAALQVMGDAGEHQVPGVRRAVATGIGGTLQFHTCMVLGEDR
ncbi:MAG: thiolase family protein [Acidimicrobiales bacterium]